MSMGWTQTDQDEDYLIHQEFGQDYLDDEVLMSLYSNREAMLRDIREAILRDMKREPKVNWQKEGF